MQTIKKNINDFTENELYEHHFNCENDIIVIKQQLEHRTQEKITVHNEILKRRREYQDLNAKTIEEIAKEVKE